MTLIGLDVDGDSVFTAQVNKKGSTIFIDIAVSNVNAIYKFAEGDSYVTAIDSGEVVVHKSFFPIKNKRALLKALPFQAESLTMLDPQKTVAFPLIEKKEKGSEVTFFLSLKESLKLHIEKIKNLGIDPDYVSAAAQGLARFSALIMKESPSFILHVGERQSLCLFLEEGKVCRSYTIKKGRADFLEKGKKIDLLQVEKQNDALLPKLDLFRKEVGEVLHSFATQKTGQLLITGCIVDMANLPHFLTPVVDDIVTLIFVEPEGKYSKHAVAIGIALDVMQSKDNCVQFRRGEFVAAKYLKKNWLQIASFGLVTLLLSFFIVYYVQKTTFEKTQYFQERITEIAQRENLPLRLENNVDGALMIIEQRLKDESVPLPYLFLAPKVSQVLSVIDKLPVAIEVIQFTYKTVSLPQISNLKENVLVQVDLEFVAKSAQEARQFHDLLQKASFVNQSKRINWEEKNASYHTSFFLKNLTLGDL